MDEFSLEKIAQKIHFGKTKNYFEEVLSSYHNKNYRSAVVMLWSVVVCDLVYKLQNLIDLYSDASAKLILDEVTSIQEADPKSSGWEVKLLDETFNKTNLLNSIEYEDLRYLQKQRHLSAHPVLNHRRELFTPKKETVRSLLRNALEGLLIKPPFYAQSILNELLEDISENTDALNTREKLKRYIESRYLSRMNSEVECLIYRSLWKFVFKLNNPECELNRKVNYWSLEIIGKRIKTKLISIIENEKDYYSNISSNGLSLEYLTIYLGRNPDIYNILSEDAKLKIQHCIENTNAGKIAGWYIKNNLEEYYNELRNRIREEVSLDIDIFMWNYIFEISDTTEWQDKCCYLISDYYIRSINYDQADIRFIQALKSRLHLFNIELFKYLLLKINNNNQTYHRSAAKEDHLLIKEKILLIDDSFDLSEYQYFKNSIE